MDQSDIIISSSSDEGSTVNVNETRSSDKKQKSNLRKILLRSRISCSVNANLVSSPQDASLITNSTDALARARLGKAPLQIHGPSTFPTSRYSEDASVKKNAIQPTFGLSPTKTFGNHKDFSNTAEKSTSSSTVALQGKSFHTSFEKIHSSNILNYIKGSFSKKQRLNYWIRIALATLMNISIIIEAISWLTQFRNATFRPPYVNHCSTQVHDLGNFYQIQPSRSISRNKVQDGRLQTLFDSVDQNKDGYIRQQEMRQFVYKNRDNSYNLLDEPQEIDSSVSNTLRTIDLNADDTLSTSDLRMYWSRLGSLLTVDEVADWVYHSVQLPIHVANTFRENLITGYDFPDLMANGGAQLSEELGVHKSGFRKRLLQHMEWKMWAMGDNPSPPSHIKWSPSAANDTILSITWMKSDPALDAHHIFPVHRYVLKRRKEDVWTAIYEGSDISCFDKEAQWGETNEYRLYAWNALGHSDAFQFEVYFQKDRTGEVQRKGSLLEYIICERRVSRAPNFCTWSLLLHFFSISAFLLVVYSRFKPTRISYENEKNNIETRKRFSLSMILLAVFSSLYPIKVLRKEKKNNDDCTSFETTIDSDVSNDCSSDKINPYANQHQTFEQPISVQRSVKSSQRKSFRHVFTKSMRVMSSGSIRDSPERVKSSDCQFCRPSEMKWYSIKHTCQVCGKKFCCRHGTACHDIPVCPVGSDCFCQECCHYS